MLEASTRTTTRPRAAVGRGASTTSSPSGLTLDTYSHVIPGMQERATARLDALLTPKTKTKKA